MKKTDGRKYKEKMTILGRKQKPDRGIICVVKGLINEDGLIDQRGRTDIAVYNRWL